MIDKGEICINILLKAFGGMVCALTKHKRGKRVGFPVDGKQLYRCRRCGATHSRKVKKEKIT